MMMYSMILRLSLNWLTVKLCRLRRLIRSPFRSLWFLIRRVKFILLCMLLVLLGFLLGQLLPPTPLSSALDGLLVQIPGLAV